jgi:hypothetical protein
MYTSNVTFSFMINDIPINERVASLFGPLKTHHTALQILPAMNNPKLNPIASANNVPSSPDAFSQYFSGITQNSKLIQLYATTVSTLRINQLKHSKGTFEYLRKWGIFMKYNQVKSTQVKGAVGWLYNKTSGSR